jgi:hypothetical protein
VTAAAYYVSEERWVFYDPAFCGTRIEIFTHDEFAPVLGSMMERATVLRVASRFDRNSTPAAWHCVGAIKALLGLRSCALSPSGLFRDLLRHGAEPVEVENGWSFRGQAEAGPNSARGSRGQEASAARG